MNKGGNFFQFVEIQCQSTQCTSSTNFQLGLPGRIMTNLSKKGKQELFCYKLIRFLVYQSKEES